MNFYDLWNYQLNNREQKRKKLLPEERMKRQIQIHKQKQAERKTVKEKGE